MAKGKKLRRANHAGYAKKRQRWLERFAHLTTEERAALVSPEHATTEFEVQAYLYLELRSLGWHVRGELKPKSLQVRFDLVVFDAGKRAIRIIEVKKHRKPLTFDEDKANRRQIDRYLEFGIPITTVYGMDQARSFIRNCTATSLPEPTQSPVEREVKPLPHAESGHDRLPLPKLNPRKPTPPPATPPSGNTVTLTREMIFAGANGPAGFTAKQLKLIGAGWPVESGWVHRTVGRQIPEEDYQKFLSLKTK